MKTGFLHKRLSVIEREKENIFSFHAVANILAEGQYKKTTTFSLPIFIKKVLFCFDFLHLVVRELIIVPHRARLPKFTQII